jgi:hypothetical protein
MTRFRLHPMRFCIGALAAACVLSTAQAAETMERYYAHPAVHDQHGVIAPWYTGQNGQFDYRIRIASETLRRYPWVTTDKAAGIAPEYAYNNTWRITPEGTISTPPLENWLSGGRGQASARVLLAWIDYYRYSGDPAALAHMEVVADTLLKYSQTDAKHPWPNFLISVPVAGVPYHQALPDGWIQLDIVGEAAVSLLRAYQIVGKKEWLDTVKHWADVFVQKRDRTPGAAPWGRYANPEVVRWGKNRNANIQTGGLVYQLQMFDELIRLGYTGKNGEVVEARDAARTYFRDVLLPLWADNDTFGRNYWDWENPVQVQTTSDWVARYLIDNRDVFPNWKNDVRNLLMTFITRATASPKSKGEVYSGAWQYPESSGCCDSSLSWGPMELALNFAQYATVADDEWAREQSRRQMILATYDVHETGVVEDNIDGGTIAAGEWFNGTHPSALHWILTAMGWLPEVMGPARENHIMRSSAVVTSVQYGKDRIQYATYDAPADTIDVLRLAYEPRRISADGTALTKRADLGSNGYTLKPISNGDFIVSIRHDGAKAVTIEGRDPQQVIGNGAMKFSGDWQRADTARATSTAGAEVSFSFSGNQVRLLGAVGPAGGKADIYLDGVKQLVGIDFWNPRDLKQQQVYYRNGLSQGRHTLRIVANSDRNPMSTGTLVQIDSAQHSSATGANPSGVGGGSTQTQRLLFGYAGRADYIDTAGNAWRPGTDVTVRTGHVSDVVAQTWWTRKQAVLVKGTVDADLYSYGIHAKDFTVNLLVGPGTYYARLKFSENQYRELNRRAINIYINDRKVVDRFDVLATAAKLNEVEKFPGQPDTAAHRAFDLVFNDIAPVNGIIEIRMTGEQIGDAATEAILQALEVGLGNGGEGVTPVGATRS